MSARPLVGILVMRYAWFLLRCSLALAVYARRINDIAHRLVHLSDALRGDVRPCDLCIYEAGRRAAS